MPSNWRDNQREVRALREPKPPATLLDYRGDCPNCGGQMSGDGFRTVRRCEFAGDTTDIEPDAGPVYCEPPEPSA